MLFVLSVFIGRCSSPEKEISILMRYGKSTLQVVVHQLSESHLHFFIGQQVYMTQSIGTCFQNGEMCDYAMNEGPFASPPPTPLQFLLSH